ncbi:hypothetical protein [Geobacillus sp. B4113_201601]|uniref:hypothetical protein n=1 Tax=Geobacillus sp. B4113_201601 TaxID=1586290 RepID=UPI0007929BC9|nr:hypothetical protein [Geobacillus sp. B4113_201601]KYD29926.1 hypothetical protein B4113_1160 [Geobacillus sp. B4113_201601]
MLLAFQILLFILIVLFGMGLFSDESRENKNRYLSVVLASVIALSVSLFVG